MSHVPSNIHQNARPRVLYVLADLLVVVSHATTDLSQVDSQHLINKIFYRREVNDVRPLVEVSKQQPVANCVLVQVIVWVRHS